MPRYDAWMRRLLPVLSIVAGIAIYQTCLSGVVSSERYLPSVWRIGAATWEILGMPNFWLQLGFSYLHAIAGFAIASVIAVPLGLVSGRSPETHAALRVSVDFLRAIPAISIAPLVMLVWGPSSSTFLFLVAFTLTFPIYMQTVYGVLDTNPVALDTARVFGLSRVGRLFLIILPSTAGYLATAVRLFVIVAVLTQIGAELIVGGGSGVGSLIFGFIERGDYALIYGLALLLGIVGLTVVTLIGLAERPVLRWHASHREVTG